MESSGVAPGGMVSAASGKGVMWTGRVLSALAVMPMLGSAIGKLTHNAQAVNGLSRFGYAGRLVTPLGVVEIMCAVLYVVPRTAILGAILITAYFGGAVATMVRLGDRGFFMPGVIAGLAWLGLWLREPRLRELTPVRRSGNH